MPRSPAPELLRRLAANLAVLAGLLVVFSLLLGILLYVRTAPSSLALPSEPIRPTFASKPAAAPLPYRLWTAPAEGRLAQRSAGEQALIRYGRELIAHTADFLGPRGKVARLSNGMNCQNCHLKAGTQPWGNNYFAVQATYPKFRERSGSVENQVKRINDCFERSLNGRKLDSTRREMRAMLAYIEWLGTDVPPNNPPAGTGIYKLSALTRACDPVRGRLVYTQKCLICHQRNGEGTSANDARSYTYPPLWGPHSYNTGAGLYRISHFAGYVKYNMPFGVTFENPQLSDEEAWDVAAYVNSMPRPAMNLSGDWPKIAQKPFDHPFGPYADPFTERQHKYGPYQPIREWKEAKKKKNNTKP